MAYLQDIMVQGQKTNIIGEGSVFGNEEKIGSGWRKFKARIIASSAGMIFGGGVLLLSGLAITNPAVVHPNMEPTPGVVADVAASQASMARIEYYLPYPGILPDSPLYKIKALRDRIALWLTFDPAEKSKKELLYADKRINAAIFLMQGGKGGLAVSTATKAEKYLESAAGVAVGEEKSGKDEKSLLLNLDKSGKKHLEVLKDLEVNVSGEDLKALQVAEATTQSVINKVEQAVLESK